MSRSLGRNVPRLDLELFRDSAMVTYIESAPLTEAAIFFPTLDGGIQWSPASVTQTGVIAENGQEFGRAVWSIEPALSNSIPQRDASGGLTPVELWVDGVAVAAGFVVRRGGDVNLPAPDDANPTPSVLYFPGSDLYPTPTFYPTGA